MNAQVRERLAPNPRLRLREQFHEVARFNRREWEPRPAETQCEDWSVRSNTRSCAKALLILGNASVAHQPLKIEKNA